MRVDQFSPIATKENVDKENGILFGVSVISLGEAKTHDLLVDDTTLNQVVELGRAFKDGLKVRMNHPSAATGSTVQSIIGTLKNFRKESDRVRADLHLLKSDEHFEKLLEMAEKMPENFGLSISYSGLPEDVMVRCSEIYACDLVDSPAANPTGLFSKHEEPDGNETEMCGHCGKANHLCSCKQMASDDHYSEYGDVPYADSENHKYPVDTESHVRAAWSYINMPKNAKKYSPEKLAKVKGKIKSAAKRHGIKISDSSENKKNDMSTTLYEVLGLEETASKDQVMEALKKALSPTVDLSEVTGKIEALEKKIPEIDVKALEATVKELKQNNEVALQLSKKAEIDNLMAEASRDGKIVPLEVDDIYTAKDGKIEIKIEPTMLAKMIGKLPKGQINLSRRPSKPAVNEKGEALKGDDLVAFRREQRAEGARHLGQIFASIRNATTLNPN